MEPTSNQPYQPQQPLPGQPVGPQAMQNGQSIPLQHAPQTPMPSAGIPEWQRGLASQVPPAPYQVEPSMETVPTPAPDYGATPAPSAPPAPAPIQPPAASVAQAFDTPDRSTMPAASDTPLAETPYQPHTPVRLPGPPGPPVYSTEQLQPESAPRPARVWQQPPTAQSPNEISMPGPGASQYQRPAPVATPVAANNYNQLAAENVHRNRRPLFIIATVLIVLLLGAAAYFSFVRKDNDAAYNDDGLKTSQVQNVRLADQDTAMLTPPKTIDGYKELKTGTDTIRSFVANDGKCTLVIGTVSAGQLPGNTINEIIKPQLDQLRTTGATVEGPNAAEALKIKDVKDVNKSYNLDTVSYKYTQGKTQTITHYSAAILKNGDRVVVNRTCHNDGTVDENGLKKLDAAVTQIIAKTTAKQ